MWVNLDRARDKLPYSMSNWKNRQLLQCHLHIYPPQILFYRLWKNCRSQPLFLAYLSSPLKKVRFPSTAPSSYYRNHSKRHMCVQLRTLSPCAAAEGYLSIIVPILPTLSLPNALPLFFFLPGEGAWRLGYISSYQIWSSQLFFNFFLNSCLTSLCNRMVMADLRQSEKTRAAQSFACLQSYHSNKYQYSP